MGAEAGPTLGRSELTQAVFSRHSLLADVVGESSLEEEAFRMGLERWGNNYYHLCLWTWISPDNWKPMVMSPASCLTVVKGHFPFIRHCRLSSLS